MARIRAGIGNRAKRLKRVGLTAALLLVVLPGQSFAQLSQFLQALPPLLQTPGRAYVPPQQPIPAPPEPRSHSAAPPTTFRPPSQLEQRFASPVGPAPERPSFDCSRARLAAEQAICRDASLARLDRDLNQSYLNVRAEAQPDRLDELVQEQRGWASRRNACGADVPCLQRSMEDRIADLQHGGALPSTQAAALPDAAASGPSAGDAAAADPAAAANAQAAIPAWKLPIALGRPVLDVPSPSPQSTVFPAWPRALAAMGVAVLPDPAKDISDRRATDLACLLLDRTATAALYGDSPLFSEHDVCRSLFGTPQLAVKALIGKGAEAWRAQELPVLLRTAPRLPLSLILRVEARLSEYDRGSGSYALIGPYSTDGTTVVLGTSMDLHLPVRWRVSEADAIAFETRNGRSRPLKVYVGIPAVITGVANLDVAQPPDPATALPAGALWSISAGAPVLYEDAALERALPDGLARQDQLSTAGAQARDDAATDQLALANSHDAAAKWSLHLLDGMLVVPMDGDVLQITSLGQATGLTGQGSSSDPLRIQQSNLRRALIAAGLAAFPGEIASIPDTAMRVIGCELLEPQRRQVLFAPNCGAVATNLPAPGQEFALRDAVATFRAADLPAILAQAPRLPLALKVQTRIRFNPWDPASGGFRTANPSIGSPNLFGTALPYTFPATWPASEPEARSFAASRPTQRTMGGAMLDYSAVLSVPVTFTGIRRLASQPMNWAQSGESGLWNDRVWDVAAGSATLYSDAAERSVLYRYAGRLDFPTPIEGTARAKAPEPAGPIVIDSETPALLVVKYGDASLPQPDWAILAQRRLATESYLRHDPSWQLKDPWGVFFQRDPRAPAADLTPSDIEQYHDWALKRAAMMPDTLELQQGTPFSTEPRRLSVFDRQTGSSWLGSRPDNYNSWPTALLQRGIAADQLLPVTLTYPLPRTDAPAGGRNTGGGSTPLVVLFALPQPWRNYVMDIPPVRPTAEQTGQPNPTLPTLRAAFRVASLEDIQLQPAAAAHALLVRLEPTGASLRTAAGAVATTSFPAAPWPAPMEIPRPAASVVMQAPSAASPPAGNAPPPKVPRVDPGQRLAAGPYGPDLLGMRIGMPIAEAEALVRAHMHVVRVLETAPPPAGSLPDLHGKLFVADDRPNSYFSEEIAIFDEPSPQPGKLVAATRSLYVGEGLPDRLLHGLADKYGPPNVKLSRPGMTAWGDGDSAVCLGMGVGRNPNWTENGQPLPRRPDASVQPNIAPRPPPANDPPERYGNCGPLVAAAFLGPESMADAVPLQHFATWLFDPALLAQRGALWRAAPLSGGVDIKF